MLSRIAQAQLGRTAARFTSTPALRTCTIAPASIASSTWIRTYAKGRRTPNSPANNPTPRKPTQPPTQASQSSQVPNDTASAPSQTPSPSAGKPTEAPVEEEEIPFHKLPDLTQGIPSTLEAELDQRQGREEGTSALANVEQSSRGGGGGDRERYVPTSERNRKWWTRFILGTTSLGAATSIVYMGRNWDDEVEAKLHPDVPNGWGPDLWWQRVRARMGDSVSYYQEPAFDKLLPDPDPSFERPYTLCLSLDNLLVHSEWSRAHGWRVAKRPGADYFIRYLGQYYELVLFTSVPFATGEPLVRKLDPFRFIMWPLYREATKFEDGAIVKDLSYLNRDLSKVIIIDSNANSVRKQPENAIVLDPWKGDPKDQDLVSLIPFLEYIHTMQYSDVRKILKSFDGKHIPTEFARREAIARKEFNARVATEKSKHHRPSGMGALGSMLGLDAKNMSMTVNPEGEINPAEAFAQGKMLQDIARERGQRNYEMLEKEIRENGEKWLKEEQVAMEKAQKEAMDSMFGGFSGWFVPTPKKEEAKAEEKK